LKKTPLFSFASAYCCHDLFADLPAPYSIILTHPRACHRPRTTPNTIRALAHSTINNNNNNHSNIVNTTSHIPTHPTNPSRSSLQRKPIIHRLTRQTPKASRRISRRTRSTFKGRLDSPSNSKKFPITLRIPARIAPIVRRAIILRQVRDSPIFNACDAL
jgi:hypothetical protein